MKKFYRISFLFLLCLFSRQDLKAQLVPYYTFNWTYNTYTPISGSTVYATGSSIFNQTFPETLPFSFTFDGTPYTQIYISSNGFLSFGATDPGGAEYNPISSTSTGFEVVSGYGFNLWGLDGTTSLSSQTIGTAPNRIFVAQWTDFTYGISTGIVYNFQVRLHETTNVVEIEYGNMSTTINTTYGQVGLRGLNNTVFNNISSTSDWTSTSPGGTDDVTVTLSPTDMPLSGLTYTWNPPPACNTPVAQPAALVFTPGLTSMSGSFAASVPAADNYLVVQTPGVPMTSMPVNGTSYPIGSSLGGGTVVGNTVTSFSSTGLTDNTYYTYTIFSFNNFACSNPAYNTTSPLTGTIETYGPKSYTWIGTTGTGSFATPSNWTPARNYDDPGDTLYFTNGGTVTITDVPMQTLNGLVISNGTHVTMQSDYTDSLVLQSFFDLNSGSLTLSGTNTLNIGFSSGASATGLINGTLNLGGNCGYNATNSLTTINGTVNDSANASFTTYCSCNSSILFGSGSTYNHYRDGGVIPQGIYDANSQITIYGIISNPPYFSTGVDIGSLTWNSTGQNANITIANISNIMGNFDIISTGTDTLVYGATGLGLNVWKDFNETGGAYRITNSTGQLKVFGNTYLNGGILDLTGYNSSSYNTTNLLLHGNLYQGILNGITKTGSCPSVISFCGDLHQDVNVSGSFVNAQISFVLNNGSGATLTGSLPVNNNSSNTIIFGSWDGTGSFGYNSTNDTLNYAGSNNIAASGVEWPNVNPPATVILNMTGGTNANMVAMPGDRTLNNTIITHSGILVLNNYNLSISNPDAWLQGPLDTTGMIAADSTGQLILAIPAMTGAITYPEYYWPIGNIKGNKTFDIVYCDFITNSVPRNIGIRVTPHQHPNDSSTTNYLNKYWTITDDGDTAAFSYSSLSFYYASSDVTGVTDLSLNSWNDTAWTAIPSTAAAAYMYTDGGTLSSYIYPLGGRQFTGRPTNHNVYSWTGATNTDYTIPANWSPSRITPEPSDVLLFNNGTTDTVTNITLDETINKLVFTNNTIAYWFEQTTTTTSHYDYSIVNYIAADTAFIIDSGSALYLSGTINPINIVFNYYTGAANGMIAGRLEFQNTTVNNSIDFSYSSTTVTPTGVIAAGSSNINQSISSSASSLIINGIYENKFTTTPGFIPIAQWGPDALVLIDGYTACYSTVNQNVTIPNLTYNCPLQTVEYYYAILPNVTHTFSVVSTGSSKILFDVDPFNYPFTVNNYYQTGGQVDIYNVQFNVGGIFNQSGGTFFSSGTGSGPSSSAILNFDGTSNQPVSFLNAAPAGPITYRIANTTGISLSGTGALTSAFNINGYGGIDIAVPGSGLINTSLSLQYAASNTTLTYDTINRLITGTYVADTIVYPAVNGPQNLTLNVNSGSELLLPFSRTIPGTLTMQRGDIYTDSNSITIGSSATAPGSLAWSSGYIVPGTGTLTRWYKTSGLPTEALTSVGFYPLMCNGSHRNVSLYFSSSIALSAGGTISVSAIDTPGITTGLAIADGTETITARSNAYWNFTTGAGITLTGSMGAAITGGGLLPAATASTLDMVQATGVVGTYVRETGIYPDVVVARNSMTLANLTSGAFYLGTPDTIPVITPTYYISVANGNWSNPATWNLGAVPPAGATVYIANNDTVVVDADTCVANILTINGGSTLTGGTGGKLTVDSIIVNYGTLTISADTVIMGPIGGGQYPFVSSGTLNVDSGNLYINGSMLLPNNSYFNQYGGNIFIDGNYYDDESLSTTSGVSLLEIDSCVVNAVSGNIMFIDPPIAFSSTMLDTQSVGPGFGSGHSIIFGDGISTSSGYIFNFGFAVSIPVNNVVVNGTPAVGTGSYRACYASYRLITINGDITLNNVGGEFNEQGAKIILLGNIYAGAGTIYDQTGYLEFANPSLPQSVNGPGTYIVDYSSPVSNFRSLTINNGSTGGVSLNMNNPTFNSELLFTKGTIHADTGALINLVYDDYVTGGPTTGWVTGKYQVSVPPGGYSDLFFPVGDSNYYSGVTISIPSGAVINTGNITINTAPGDHPLIASSEINPAASINRYYTIVTGSGLNLAAYSSTMTLNWNLADEDTGVNWTTLIANNYTGGSWHEDLVAPASPTSIMVTNLGNNIAGDFQLGMRSPYPFITQQPVSDTVCAGNSLNFIVSTPVAGGFQWQVNSGSGWNNLTDGTLYSGSLNDTLDITAAPDSVNGYHYRCAIYNGTDTSYSSAAILTVDSPVTPLVSISPATSDTICMGSTISYTATPTNGGTAPLYQWTLNGMDTATGNTFNFTGLATNDTVRCIMTSNLSCLTNYTDTSAFAVVMVNPVYAPSVSIAASIHDTICAGTAVSFTATATAAGSTPAYIWKKNGVTTGSDSTSYSISTLGSGDVITCVVLSSYVCATPDTAESNAITMTVNPIITPTITVSSVPARDTICAGTSLTFTATSNYSAASFQWSINTIAVSGATNTSYHYYPSDNDHVSCTITDTTGCYASYSVAASLTLTVDSNIIPVLTITGTDSLCAGTLDTFTATTNVAGGIIQWQVNSINRSSGATYIYSPLNGDIVSAIVTAPASACYLPAYDTSGSLTITAYPIIIPTIIISGPLSIGLDSTVNLTAALTDTGATYIIVWKKNGVIFDTTSMPTVSYVKGAGTDTITAYVIPTSPGCYDTTLSAVIYILVRPTGVQYITGVDEIMAYPNPFHDLITITGLKKDDEIAIYDVMGRQLGTAMTVNSDEPRLTYLLTDLPAGSYMLNVRRNNEIIRHIAMVKLK